MGSLPCPVNFIMEDKRIFFLNTCCGKTTWSSAFHNRYKEMAEFEDNSLLLGTAKHVASAPKRNICHHEMDNAPVPEMKKPI